MAKHFLADGAPKLKNYQVPNIVIVVNLLAVLTGNIHTIEPKVLRVRVLSAVLNPDIL